MDTIIIAEKLESLRKCVLRIEEKTPANADVLINDSDLQDIVALNLSRAVQLSVDIGAHVVSCLQLSAPNTMAMVFDALGQANIIDAITADSLKKAVGFRNIAVHSYEKINWLIVHAIAQTKVADFKSFARQINKFIEII